MMELNHANYANTVFPVNKPQNQQSARIGLYVLIPTRFWHIMACLQSWHQCNNSVKN